MAALPRANLFTRSLPAGGEALESRNASNICWHTGGRDPHVGTVADTIDLLHDRVPALLIDAPAWQRLRAVATTLPAMLSNCVYLECRPDDANAADLIVGVNPAGRAVLAGSNPVLHLPQSLRAHATWARIERLAQHWNNPVDALHEGLAGAWLEFDCGSGSGQTRTPAPSLFVDFSPNTCHATTVAERCAPLRRVAALLGHTMPADALRVLERMLDGSASSGQLLYAGFMLGRDVNAVRLCVTGLFREALAGYLRSLAWPGHATPLMELVESVADDAGGAQDRPAIVHLDLSTSIGPSIGLEYPFARVPQLRGELAEDGLLEALQRRGLLSHAQCAQLKMWPSIERRTMPHELWPSHLMRRVNHVKLVLDGHGRLGAKVYLCAEHLPATVAALQ